MSDHTAEQKAHEDAIRDRAADEQCFYITVRVYDSKFSRPTKPLTYCCSFADVVEGDLVVVPYSTENRLRLGRVYEVNPPHDLKKYATKWVAAHGNWKAHEMRMALGVPQLTN